MQLAFTFTKTFDEQFSEAIAEALALDGDLFAAASNWKTRRGGDLHPADIRWLRTASKRIVGYEQFNDMLGVEFLDAVADEVANQHHAAH